MKSESLDLAALEYTKLNVNTYILTVFPIAAKKVDDINSIIERYGKIYYQKDIYFNSAGALNFVRQLYYGELWAGDFKKGFPGERQKVEQCFRENIPLKAYFLETDSLDKVKVCKKEIRSLFDYGNNSAHATDGRDETIRIAEQLLNNNSIHFLNNSNYVYSNKLENMLLTYKKWMNENSYDKDSFCLDSGAVLNIYGIRDTRDLDFLYFGNENLKNTPEHIDNHQSELIYYERSPEEIIFNPANYFYYNGLKFASLNVVMKMKLKRNEVKDKRDVILIKRILSNSFSIYQALLSARYKTLQELRYFPDRIKYLVLKISPSGMLPYLKAVYRIPGKIKAISYSLYECLGPYERTRIYKGFNLAYTRGYSLVSRIIGNGIYEPKLSQEIVKELRKTKSGYFLDVGANIGLVSLNVLSELPNMKIFCIEPGPEQAGQLRRTININNLTGQMQLFQCALGDNEGESQFAVHSSLNTSGDGFFDSKLAVKCSFITVPVNTLDNWWRSAGSCLIKVVKIDTEGAELWILRGGERFIRQCRPTILLEIDRRYIKPYPYHERDLLKYLEMMQYGLKTLDETRVTSNNFDYCLGETNSYVATPNEHDAG